MVKTQAKATAAVTATGESRDRDVSGAAPEKPAEGSHVPNRRPWRGVWLGRLRVVLLLGGVSFMVWRAFSGSDQRSGPAGFKAGVVDGAVMPVALPWLLLGRDVTLYDIDNTGRSYKIGYTCGVNGCGAVFFGSFYWRVLRWRKGRS